MQGQNLMRRDKWHNQAVAGTPEMIGYGLAKAAVHQLTASLAEEKSGQSTMITVIRVDYGRIFIANIDYGSLD